MLSHLSKAALCAASVSCFFIGVSPAEAASTFSTYGGSYRSIATPPVGAGSFAVAGDALADGRLVTVTGDAVFLETGVATGQFQLAATIDTSLIGGAVDPSFLSVSPDGSRIAIGAGFGKPVVVFGASALNASSPTLLSVVNATFFNIPHFDATWRDNTSLAVTAGSFGSPAVVTLLDTLSDPLAPINPTIISNIGGASAGVAFDSAGRLLTGNGFDLGPGGSSTGWIKAFDPADWSAGAADFEAQGVFVGDVLSATSLRFDNVGNLFVGGGDFATGDAGALVVVSADAVAAALAGVAPVDSFDPLSVRRLDPQGDGLGFFGSAYNPVTGELYITQGGVWTATIPSPPASALMVIACLRRRRRRAA